MQKLLIAGFNPAWQQTYVLADLFISEVNRASEFYECASGKGINALRALQYLGKEASILQFVGGDNGKKILESLGNVTNYSVFSEREETRVCSTLISRSLGNATEIVGPSAILSNEEQMLKVIANLPSYDALLISGSLPNGISPNVYRALFLKQSSAVKIVDAFVSIEILFDLPIDLLKINLGELFLLSKKSILKEACDWVFSKSKVATLFITDGSNGAWVISKNFTITVKAPEVKVINPIGAGDTLAGFLLKQLAKKVPISAEKWEELAEAGLALASQSCANVMPGLIGAEKRGF
ncbi:MAG: 1-phosphofructokinase family hexose kinase [Lentisphaeria bacterium]